jgi:hypothetical protein
MNRSCSSATAVFRSPQSTAAPRLRAAMLGQQLRGSVQVKVDAEHLSGPNGDRLPVLAKTIASNPLAHGFGLNTGESGLARRTFQCGLQASGCAPMEPAVNAAWFDANERSNGFDQSAVLQFRQGPEPLTPMLVAILHGLFTQVRGAEAIQPRFPRALALRPFGARRCEYDPQPVFHDGLEVREGSEQPFEARRQQCSDGSRQALAEIAQQPGQKQQPAVVLLPRDALPLTLGHSEIAADAGEQTITSSRREIVTLLLRATRPEHREEHVGERHGRWPVERADAGEDSRSASLACGESRLQIENGGMRRKTLRVSQRSCAAPAKKIDRLQTGQAAQPQRLAAEGAPSAERRLVTRARARPAERPDQLEMRARRFGEALCTDVDPAETNLTILTNGPPVRGKSIRFLIVRRGGPIAQRHLDETRRIDASPAFDPLQRRGIGATPPFTVPPNIDAECIAAKNARRHAENGGKRRHPGDQSLAVDRSNMPRQAGATVKRRRPRRHLEQIRPQHDDARRDG